MKAGPEISVHVVHTSQGEDAHRVDALLDLGSHSRLLEGAQVFHDQAVSVDAVVWACTSGSFVYGWEGARQQVEVIAQATGVPASSTSFAFVDASKALGISKVAISATYPEDVSNYFRDFLAAGGIEIVHMGYHDILTAEEAGTFAQAHVEEMIRSDNHRAAEAILLPDTALHSAAWLERLEEAEGCSYSLMSYLEATMQRANLGVKLSQFHEHFDLLLTPTLPIPAFAAGHEVPQGWQGRRWQTWTPFTYPFNLTQQPAISVPCGMTTSGLPIGLQLVGAKYRDALVLRAAYAYESSSPMQRRPPV